MRRKRPANAAPFLAGCAALVALLGCEDGRGRQGGSGGHENGGDSGPGASSDASAASTSGGAGDPDGGVLATGASSGGAGDPDGGTLTTGASGGAGDPDGGATSTASGSGVDHPACHEIATHECDVCKSLPSSSCYDDVYSACKSTYETCEAYWECVRTLTTCDDSACPEC